MPSVTSEGPDLIRALDDETIEQAHATQRGHAEQLREWARAWWDAWQAHDADRVADLVADQIVYEDPSMLGEHIRGKEQFREFVAMFFRAFPDARFEQTDWPVYGAFEGVGVAVPWRVRCTFTGDMLGGPSPLELAPTGKSVVVEGVDLYEFDGGLLYRWRSVVNALEMAEQIGVAPIRRALPLLVRAQRVAAPLIRRFG